MIRAATVNDAEAIAKVHVGSWQVIYRGHFPDKYLDNLRIDDSKARWEKIVAGSSDNVAVYQSDGQIIGFVSLIDSRDNDAEPHTGEISAIYIDPGYWRQGIGGKLMTWADEKAVSRGWEKLTLWVLEGNDRARSFYEALGWKTDGATKMDEREQFCAFEIRYVWQCLA